VEENQAPGEVPDKTRTLRLYFAFLLLSEEVLDRRERFTNVRFLALVRLADDFDPALEEQDWTDKASLDR